MREHREAPASLKRCIKVIFCIELKYSYCKILESVPAVFAMLSRNFHPAAVLSAFAGNQQSIDGLSLKKSLSVCSVLGPNIDISFGPNAR